MGKKSKDKGRRGEQVIVKAFTAWWGEKFYRTPGSGSFSTRGFNPEVMNLAGDVVTTDQSFPFCVECKNAEGWDFFQIFTAPSSELFQWWDQAVNQCPEDKWPLLVFTRNHKPWFFMTKEMAFCVALSAWEDRPLMWTWINGDCVAVGLLNDLFDKTTPKLWRTYGGKGNKTSTV